MLAPMLGGRNVPAYIKLALASGISAVLFPLLAQGHVLPANSVEYLMLVVRESLVGLSLGFISQQLLFVLQGAGQIIDMQMGLSIGSLIDPINATPSPLTGNFKVLVAVLLLLATNAHHYLIAAVVRSYDYIPLLGTGPSPGLISYGIEFITGVFSGAVQIALPVAGILLLVEVALGFLSRALPQLNIFFVGFPVKLGLGFLLLLWLVPLLGSQTENLFQVSLKEMHVFMQGWGKP